MADSKLDIDSWVARIQKTRSGTELLRILAEFRKHEWTDLERQKVSHTYMKVLETILSSSGEQLKKAQEAATAAANASGNDGPVWYEKM